MIKKIIFCKEEAWEVKNDVLRCVILPNHGGKVVSICRRENGFELLFQNPCDKFKKAHLGSPFEEFEACGFDDAFPSIDSGYVVVGSKIIEYPDHGEIWSARFDCNMQGESLYLKYRSNFLGYFYEKWFTLKDDRLTCSYRITNQGSEPFPYIWACHCLVTYMPDMRLIYPDGTKAIEVAADSKFLGAATTIHPFPEVINGAYDFTRVPKPDPDRMEKYYVSETVEKGNCGYRYPSAQMAAELEYDAKKLPHLGFWITTGGYRGDQNCAFEPAVGYYDSIETAMKNNSLKWLNPGETISFDLNIRLYPWKMQNCKGGGEGNEK